VKARTLLRIAAIITAVQAAAHTFGGVLGPIQPGNQMIAAAAMKANQFDAMGSARTFWDFFIGFGLCVSVFLVLEAGLLWNIAETVDDRVTDWRFMLILLLVCNAGIGVLGVLFFFPATVIAPGVNLICMGIVLAKLLRTFQMSASTA